MGLPRVGPVWMRSVVEPAATATRRLSLSNDSGRRVEGSIFGCSDVSFRQVVQRLLQEIPGQHSEWQTAGRGRGT